MSIPIAKSEWVSSTGMINTGLSPTLALTLMLTVMLTLTLTLPQTLTLTLPEP